jgi:hypothetical protein
MDLFRSVFGYSNLVDLVMRRIDISYWLDHPVVLVYDGERQSAKTSPGTQIACALMERFSILEKRYGTKMVVMAQYPQRVEPQARQDALGVLGCATDQGIPVIDLFEPLKRILQADPSRYGRLYWGHMSAKGNQFVAEEVAKFLEEASP